MSEVLFQTMVEKLEAIELFLKATDKGNERDSEQKNVELEIVRKEFKSLLMLLQPFVSKLDSLSISVTALQEQLQRPANTQVEHKHHLHKGVWVSVGLFVTCFLLAWGWISTYQSSEILRANDIKYRYLKISANNNVRKLCYYTDSLYQKDGAGFSSNVDKTEQRLIEQANLLRLAGEKEKEAKTLKDRAGSK